MGLLLKLLPAVGALALVSALVLLSARGSLYAWAAATSFRWNQPGHDGAAAWNAGGPRARRSL